MKSSIAEKTNKRDQNVIQSSEFESLQIRESPQIYP